MFVTCLFVRRHLDSIVQPRRKKEKEEIVFLFLFASTKSEKWRNEIVLWVCLNERKRISFSPFDGKNFNFFFFVRLVRPSVCVFFDPWWNDSYLSLSLFSYWLTLTMSCVNTHTHTHSRKAEFVVTGCWEMLSFHRRNGRGQQPKPNKTKIIIYPSSFFFFSFLKLCAKGGKKKKKTDLFHIFGVTKEEEERVSLI